MKYYQNILYYHAEYGRSDTLYTFDNLHFLPYADFIKDITDLKRVKVSEVIETVDGDIVCCEEV